MVYSITSLLVVAAVVSAPAKPMKEIVSTLKKRRELDFIAEGNVPVTFSVGADSTDKKELGRLRFDMMHDLKYLMAYPVIDRESLFRSVRERGPAYATRRGIFGDRTL